MRKRKQNYSYNQNDSASSEFQANLVSSSSSMNHQNSECVRREKIEKLRKKKRRIYNTKSKGNWNIDEDQRFMQFMLQNRQSFQIRQFRRSNKIFKKMARFIRTRCPQQCRSHHQKYEKKYVTFDNIIAFIGRKSQNPNFIQQRQVQNKPKSQQLNQIKIENIQLKQDNFFELRKTQGPTKTPKEVLLIQKQQGVYELSFSQKPQFQISIIFNIQKLQSY